MQGGEPIRVRPHSLCPSVRSVESGLGEGVAWGRPSEPCFSPPSEHRRALRPAGAGLECSRPASVIRNRWMGGGRSPAFPPSAIQAGAGREGKGGRKAGESGPAGTAACVRACQARRGHVPGQVWGWQKRGLALGAEN